MDNNHLVITNYDIIADGEEIALWNEDEDGGESEVIKMKRNVAIQLAWRILEEME